MDKAQRIDRLKRYGKVLYGPRWQTDLSRDLKLSDARRMRQWIAGDRGIPSWVWGAIEDLLRQRKEDIDRVMGEYDGD